MQSGCQAKDGADGPSSPEYRLHLHFVDGKLMELPKDVKPEIGGSLQPQNNEPVSSGSLQQLQNKEPASGGSLQPQNNEPVSSGSLQPQNKKPVSGGSLQLQRDDMRELPVTKPHFCGVQRLGHLALGINSTEQNQAMYVRQWTNDCTKEHKPLVFDVDGKELANPGDAYGAVNVIDLLKCSGPKKSQASILAKPDEIMKLGIDRRDIFLLHFDGNPQVRN